MRRSRPVRELQKAGGADQAPAVTAAWPIRSADTRAGCSAPAGWGGRGPEGDGAQFPGTVQPRATSEANEHVMPNFGASRDAARSGAADSGRLKRGRAATELRGDQFAQCARGQGSAASARRAAPPRKRNGASRNARELETRGKATWPEAQGVADPVVRRKEGRPSNRAEAEDGPTDGRARPKRGLGAEAGALGLGKTRRAGAAHGGPKPSPAADARRIQRTIRRRKELERAARPLGGGATRRERGGGQRAGLLRRWLRPRR